MHALNELIDKHDMISGIKVFIKNILLRIVFKVADTLLSATKQNPIPTNFDLTRVQR